MDFTPKTYEYLFPAFFFRP